MEGLNLSPLSFTLDYLHPVYDIHLLERNKEMKDPKAAMPVKGSAPQWKWTPKRRLAQVRNFAIFKLSGMITNVLFIQHRELEKMELKEEDRANLAKDLYLAVTYLDRAKMLIKRSQT